VAVLEHTDHVVGIPNHAAAAPQPRDHLPMEPAVQDVMQKHIRQEGRQNPALRCPGLRDRPDPIFQHAGFEPLVDQSTQQSILDPLVQHRPQLAVIDRPEEAYATLPASRYPKKSRSFAPTIPYRAKT